MVAAVVDVVDDVDGGCVSDDVAGNRDGLVEVSSVWGVVWVLEVAIVRGVWLTLCCSVWKAVH